MKSKLRNPQVRRALGLAIILLFAVIGGLPFIRTQAASSIKVQIDKGGGTDNTQETTFNFLVKNTGTSAVSGISTQIYFTLDGSNAASGYVLEKYYDQSGVATISSPTLLSGSTYYFTVNYGTASLAAGGQWEFQTALHLSSWASTYSGANDYYHTGYAVGALPASYTDTNYIPAYVSGTLAWGTTPGGATATNTNTFVPPTTAVATTPAGALPDLTITSISNAPSTVPCGSGWNPGTNVTVANQGTGNAGTFVVSLSNSGGTALMITVSSLAAGQSTTLRFNQNGGALTATADSTNVVTESNESNNSLSATLPVSDPIPCTVTPSTPTSGLPDLTITSIKLGPPIGPCFAAQGTSLVVANIGNADAGAFDVYVTGVQTLGQNVPGLTAGASITMFFNVTPPNGAITAVVDETNHVTESNENNNTASYFSPTLTQPPCPPSITPGGPSITPTPTSTPSLTPFPLTGTVTPASADITIHGSVTFTNYTCTGQTTTPRGGAAIYVSYNSGTLTKVTTTDSSGNYSVDLGNVALGTTVRVSTDNVGGGISTYYLFTHTQADNLTIDLSISSPTVTPCPTPSKSPTPTNTSTSIVTPTVPSATPCELPTPVYPMVDPLISPTALTTQIIYVSVPNGTGVTITSEAGTFSSNTTDANGKYEVTINLVPNSTNHLTVTEHVHLGGCYPDYSFGVTTDNHGNPLVIVQSMTATPPTFTPTPSSNIIVSGTITDACGNGVGIGNVDIYVGLVAGLFKLAGTTDAAGHYSVNFASAGITLFDGQTVAVIPHFTSWRFTPHYTSWVHPANTIETKTLNFQGSTSGTPTATPQFCSATPTPVNTVGPTSTTAPGGPTPTQGPTQGPVTGNITLEGFVLDGSNSVAISGATLGNGNTCTPHQPITTISDSSGFYQLDIPAVYNCGGLSITATGYTTYSIPYTQSYPGIVETYFLNRATTPGTSTATNTATNTPTATPTCACITNTPTKTATPTTPTPTPTKTNTPVATTSGTCTPNATITAPFTFDGAGTLCWKSNSLGSYINSWNLASLTINGVNITNLYVASSGYPAKASDGYWYISYNSSVSYGHFETK